MYSVGFVLFSSQLCCPLRFQNSPQTHQWEGFLLFGNFSSYMTPSPGWVSVPNSFVSLVVFYMWSYLLLMEKAMATHSSTLAWKIPWAEEPGRLQSMGSQRIGHDWATSLSRFTFLQWRRKWQPTPVFLPGESQGQGSLVGCHLWGRTESDRTEAT